MSNIRTQVLLCQGTSCMSNGATSVREALKEALHKAGLEKEVEIITAGCMGICELGPVMVIYPDGFFYQRVKPEDAEEIVQEHLLKGRVVKRLFYKKPKTEELIAKIEDIDFFKLQEKIARRNCGLIDVNTINDYIGADGFMALGKALTEMTSQEVINEVKKSGLRGRGGAGFPTGLKWDIAAKASGKQKYMLCNADEGDPGAFMDRSMLEGDSYSVLEAMMIGGYAIGSNQGYIYVRAEYPLAIERLTIAINEMRKHKLLGKNILGTGFDFDVEIRMGAGAFVCGEETALMRSIEGKRGEPQPRPPFPAHKGLFKYPSVLNNVETLSNIPYIILYGAEKFASIGTEKSKGTKIFALAGNINNTGLIEVPIGITLGKIVYNIGGGIPGNKKFKAVQIGGPSGGCIPANHLNAKVDYESLIELGSIMGSGGLIVIDEDTCMVDIARYFMEFIQEESCGKCTPCREGTRIMLEILTRICEGKGKMEDLDTLEELAYQIKDSALCGLGQTAPNPVLSTLRYFRDEYVEHIKDKKCRAGVCAELVYTPCSNSCPASVNVTAYLAYTKVGDYKKAMQAHLKNNPFPAVCGRVCPAFCESRCRRKDIDEEVNICAVKRFMADKVDNYLECFPEKQTLNRKKVAVIGGGPSGLSNAYFLTMLGYEVTVFEAQPKAGGMLTYAIPAYRLPKNIVEKEIQALVDYGVNIKTNLRIGKDITLDQLRNEGYKAFYVAAGAWNSVMPGIDNLEDPRVLNGLEFLSKFNQQEELKIGKEVLVIGGGNSAIDAARTAKRLGADVTIAYRRTREEMPADEAEINEAEREGVKIYLLQNIKSIKSQKDYLEVELVNMRLGDYDASGRRRPIEIEGSSFVRKIDCLILSIGQKPAISDFIEGEKIQLNRNNTIPTIKGITKSKDIFAGGDVALGPATVVEAIGEAQNAAEVIDFYLTGKKRIYPWRVEDPVDVEFDPEAEPVEFMRSKDCLIPVKERGIYNEVEKTWNKEIACRESSRCLRCEYRED
ncbi:MAG: NADH-quinone oxidoreductase subunit NuoF [Bacteroidales bacterium]|nr:NADH-quinone oxidoreductase subunit NuoF [Bacteroidales bacterium]